MIARLLILIIGCYQRVLSPLKPPTCRFTPTCSGYAKEALEIHGLWRGSALTARRICRCHPWGGHGHDPVPAPRQPRDRVTSPEAFR